MLLVLTRRDYPQIVERRKHLLSRKHPAHKLQNTKHIVGKSLLQTTDSLAKVFNNFSLIAIGASELHETLRFIAFEYIYLSAVPDTTNYPCIECDDGL